MSRLHLFNPENDIALATDLPHFTPPRAAIQLAESLATLPAWWADPDDLILCSPGDTTWLRDNGLLVEAFNAGSKPSSVAPWGWSRYTRTLLARKGVDSSLLPSDAQLDDIRTLSHRRLTAEVYRLLSDDPLPYPLPPAPLETDNITLIDSLLHESRSLFIKSPWSSSGRGIINTTTASPEQTLRLAQGVIRRQGSVMVEVALDKVVDFAMLYDVTDSGVVFRGLSLFYNEAHSTYAGNILGSPSFLNSLLCRYVDIDSVEATKLSVADTLTRLLYGRYRGPVGVDMLVYRAADGSLCIAPCVEVNLRMTMGRVAHELHARHLSAEFTGLMQLRHGNSPADSDIYMRLNPPGHPFSMVIRALSDADIAY